MHKNGNGEGVPRTASGGRRSAEPHAVMNEKKDLIQKKMSLVGLGEGLMHELSKALVNFCKTCGLKGSRG